MVSQALATGKIQVCEQKNVINGKTQYEKVQMVKLNDHEVLEIIRNITEHRYQEKILAGQQKVLELLARGAALPDILRQLIQVTEEQSPEMLGSILLLSEQRLWYGSAPSLPEDYINLSNGLLIRDGAGSCGTAAYLQQQVVVADIEHDPLWQDYWEIALQYNLRACWSTPIFAQSGEVLGTFAMYYREPRQPTPEDLELVKVVVNLAELAIARKRAEEASQASESRYRLLAENTNDLICLHSPNCQLVYVSPSCKLLLGYDCEELIGQTFYSFIHPEDGDRFHQEAQVVLHSLQSAKLQPITYRMRQKSGSYIWLETLTKSILDPTGQITQLQTTSRDITERVQAQESLRYGAFHDSLTGLPNRDLLIERLELAIKRIKRHYDYHFAVLFLDLDRFKVINDSLGHGAGDQLLIAVAHKLQSILRNSDLAVRLGGDEFVILLDGIKDIQDAVRATKRVFRELAIPLVIGGRELYINTSIGIAFGTNAYTQAADILRDADIAMYQAKKQGRGSYEIFNAAMHKAALYRLHLENDLRQALERQELVVYYQPIIDLRGVRIKKGMVQQQDPRKIRPEQIMGFEALVRWQHPHRGLLSPLEFIPLAEETGLIVTLDRWIFSTACQQLAAWQTKFPCYNLKMNMNLSAQDLMQGDLIAHIDAVLAATGVSGASITIEITESTLIDDINQTIALLEQLRARKIRVSIDDFGTGYSSLSYLPRLPADNLKIDRSFVGQMEQGNRNYQVVSTIIALSNQLDLGVVAEGIETMQQLQWLQELGCEFGQGYLFAQPSTSEAIEELLLASYLDRSYYLGQG
jgi:diguanylate cyclase (GGDEF)-like protein/PAS domain S-box-containing protein